MDLRVACSPSGPHEWIFCKGIQWTQVGSNQVIFVVQILGPQILLQHHSCCRAIRFSRITVCSIHSGTKLFEQPLFPGTANPLLNFSTPFHMWISSHVESVILHGTLVFLLQTNICSWFFLNNGAYLVHPSRLSNGSCCDQSSQALSMLDWLTTLHKENHLI